MAAHNLKKLGFDLAYLSLLTKAGLKPLSRWEKEFTPQTESLLRDLGLQTRTVHRSVRSGKHIRELILSGSERCLDLYASRFDGTPIDRSPTSRRIEGLLFGYPSCCVESFVTKGYAKNSLRRGDQRILFHWACPNCPVTPILLPYYRDIYRQCRNAMQGRLFSAVSAVREVFLIDSMRCAVAAAASLVALSALPAPEAKYTGSDPHLIPLEVWEDPDADFLASDEELLLGADPAIPDQDGNHIPDGLDLALVLSSAIDTLPRLLPPDDPPVDHRYVVDNMAFGLETCQACGDKVNMGFMEVFDPLNNVSVGIPYIAKHYMEHGSFSYSGEIHTGRVNVMLLRTIVMSTGFSHSIAQPVATDADGDELRDWEEPVFQTQPDNPDTDGDKLPDGIDIARELRAQLDLLPRVVTDDKPYVLEHPMDGIDMCPRCGSEVVMDLWEVINPLTGASISIPSMALHFMQHGAFSWEGGYAPAGRIDPRQLRAVLTGEGDGHLLYVSPDQDGDLLTDREETDLQTNPVVPDENGNQVLDGIDLAKETAAEISALPTKPSASEVYRLDVPLKGLEWCDICGQNVNMGHLTVVNPVAQLYVEVAYIAAHYMEHGSFSFAGNVHGEGRLDVELLVDALHSSGPGHILSVQHDTDGDGLTDDEEEYFGTDKTIPDTNNDGVPDGFALSHQMWEAIGALPRALKPEDGPKDRPFVVEHPLRGLETCEVCGETVNMGWIEVINPREEIVLEIPYVGLHYMRQGSFSYKGDLHNGRGNPCLLDLALRGDGTSHLVVVAGDSDGDGLLDGEEAHFGTRANVPDSNGDGILDGVALARKMRQQIGSLPVGQNPVKTYVVHCEADCYTHCPRCGEVVNCGHVGVTNPLTGLSMNIPYANLHFMERGSFAVPEAQRVDPLLLETILRPGIVIAAGENQVTLRWKGEVGKSYQVFTAEELSGPWTPGPILQGNGGELTFTTEDQIFVLHRGFYKILVW